MDLRLAGKRALVTGSSSGIGEAIAKLLAAEGVAVVVHGRDESRANAVAEAIRAGRGSAEVALGDLTTDAGADAVAVAVLNGGPLDILVNNAGVLVDNTEPSQIPLMGRGDGYDLGSGIQHQRNFWRADDPAPGPADA